MKVLKFGGSSVGTADAVRKVSDIVSGCTGEGTIVVVSALRGITDQLLSTARMALTGDVGYKAELDTMVARHRELCAEVVPDDTQAGVSARLEAMFDELTNILKGVYLIRDLSQKTTDAVLSYGERMSSVIVHGAITGSGLVDARDIIKTRPYFHKHVIDFKATDRLILEAFPGGREQVTVVPGYIASDLDTGDVTTLGRGGSDYTAAVIAAAVDASVLEIWTDVDGFMTADPKMVASAYVIEKLSYVEAIELCNFGAKVIYPPTIFPVFHKGIPIIVKNTFNPGSPGTYISSEKVVGSNKAIKGISSVADSCLITVQGLGMVGIIGVNYRIFKSLAKAGISVFFVSQAASENNTSIGVNALDADKAVEVLSQEFALEIVQGEINPVKRECGLATVAIVGENMRLTPGIAGKLFGTLGRNGINVIACAQGASETNISFVVQEKSLRKAMNVIHDSFFLSEYQVLNIFIAGIGLVGASLLEQLRLQQPTLLKENQLQVNVVGITNSRKFITDRKGIDLSDYRNQLEREGRASSPELFRDEMVRMNIFNSVFVDCTASAEVASIYQALLEKNISVVTANKIAASDRYEVYDSLRQTARRRGVKFLFETNVGAGLPIINTICDLRNSGDRINRIEAVISGTLNYIFNVMDERISFSRAIRMAQEEGYAEPDPRVDLSGKDVIRKLVILSREAGYRLEQDEVKANLFIPDRYFEGSVEDFWKAIPQLDAEFEARRRELEARGCRLRFVAVLDKGKAEVGLREVDSSSPFYELAGSNNVISLTTERYKEYPMQIKGYGAGEAVTAAGVFADIISIANIR
ncbi:MAG: bifunctional aspartate kinase/homoserine dehydrogenase I [Alistipes sp.]|nr:bifunctional aspartate kinase/homoserine dehydrogenase I [Alistipes sp.]